MRGLQWCRWCGSAGCCASGGATLFCGDTPSSCGARHCPLAHTMHTLAHTVHTLCSTTQSSPSLCSLLSTALCCCLPLSPVRDEAVARAPGDGAVADAAERRALALVGVVHAHRAAVRERRVVAVHLVAAASDDHAAAHRAGAVVAEHARERRELRLVGLSHDVMVVMATAMATMVATIVEWVAARHDGVSNAGRKRRRAKGRRGEHWRCICMRGAAARRSARRRPAIQSRPAPMGTTAPPSISHPHLEAAREHLAGRVEEEERRRVGELGARRVGEPLLQRRRVARGRHRGEAG